jgi:hypothetical protein
MGMIPMSTMFVLVTVLIKNLVRSVQIAFAPTWDGALPVLHAATTPLVHDDAQRQNTTASLRLFARGAFAWPMVQKFTTLACSYTLQY